MSTHWDKPNMRFRITVPSEDVNEVAARVKDRPPGATVRIGSPFYFNEDHIRTEMALLFNGLRFEERPPD